VRTANVENEFAQGVCVSNQVSDVNKLDNNGFIFNDPCWFCYVRQTTGI